MNFSKTTTSEWTEKQYIYRYYSRTLINVLLVIDVIMILVFAWLAITNNLFWFYLLVVFIYFASFLVHVWLASLDAKNTFVIKVSPTGIHLPFFWKRGAADYLPFSSLSAVELIQLRKATILKLAAGKKLYVISEIYFPQKEDFKELINIVQKQSPIPFSGGPV